MVTIHTTCFNIKIIISTIITINRDYSHTHTHTRCSSSFFTLTLPLRRTAFALSQYSGCSSTTGVHSETVQMAVCCKNLTLGALSSRSVLSVMVGAIFQKFGLFEHVSYVRFVVEKVTLGHAFLGADRSPTYIQQVLSLILIFILLLPE
jgi:hypothetical protein